MVSTKQSNFFMLHRRIGGSASCFVLAAICILMTTRVTGFTSMLASTRPATTTWQAQQSSLISLLATKPNKQEEKLEQSTSIFDLEEPAGVAGAEFFGGNKQKIELFDPEVEAKADQDVVVAATTYHRFEDSRAFATTEAAQIAQALQMQLNKVLYGRDDQPTTDGENAIAPLNVRYADNFSWKSCFEANAKSASNPLQALEQALDFYRLVDVAIISGKPLESSNNGIELQWQVSVVWPIFWEPRVLLTGTSQLTLGTSGSNGEIIIEHQVDTLDAGSDLVPEVAEQVTPRFWDVYHIGMTPSSEMMPRIEAKALLPRGYDCYEIPARLVSSPTQLDSIAGREDGNAQMIPNHAFSSVIKTMGPTKQRFVPASPVQVQILPPSGDRNLPTLKWSIPMSVEFLANLQLPIPGEDPEARENSQPEFRYEFQQRRRVATVPYGGMPQDVGISDIRKKLYEQVNKDGWKPKVDAAGRPQFFFVQNGSKACYTVDGGLGMCVYEWRPKFSNSNEIGIELEL